jgi:hypothetical protein
MVYNCVYYCDTYVSEAQVCVIWHRIGVVSVYLQYNCVYY